MITSRRNFLAMMATTAITPFIPKTIEPEYLFGTIHFAVHAPKSGYTILLNGKMLHFGPVYSWEGPARDQSIWAISHTQEKQFGGNK